MDIKEICICDVKRCGLYLEEPITLPCGFSVCKSHINMTNDSFKCECCKKLHPIIEGSFQINRKTENLIKNNLHLNGKHKEVKKMIDELNLLIETFKSSNLNNGETYLSKYFSELKTSVDIHYEYVVKQINQKKIQILEQLKKLEIQYKSNKNNMNEIDLNEFKQLEWMAILRNPNLSNDLLIKLEHDINKAVKNLNKQIKLYENNILMNNKITFEPLNDINFGNLSIKSFKIIYHDKSYYEGEVHENKPDGKGILYFSNGDLLDCEWKNGKANGTGTFYNHSNVNRKYSKYEGEWRDNLRHGHGIEYYSSNDKFEGEFAFGKKNGTGRMIRSDAIIEGSWTNDELDGICIYYYNNGEKYQVTHQNGLEIARTKLTTNNNRKSFIGKLKMSFKK